MRKKQPLTSNKQTEEKRKPTPTFLLELPLRVTAGQATRVRAHLEAARQLYNAILSEGQRRVGFRTSYIGSEVFISLVDPKEAPWRGDLRQLGVSTLCTNRDGPFRQRIASTGAAVSSVKSVRPWPSDRCSGRSRFVQMVSMESWRSDGRYGPSSGSTKERKTSLPT